MRMGSEPCDGIAAERKCSACMLQHRGVPRLLADLVARTPVPIAAALQRVPGRAGAMFRLPGFIADQKARQQRLLASADRFVLLNDWAARTVVANGAPPSKVVVNRLGIAARPPRKPSPDVQPTKRPVRFGYVGRFDPIKGVYDLVRALASVPASTAFRAELVGPVFTAADQHVVDQLRRMIGSDPRIAIAPAIPHAAVPAALAALDILCCPSIVAEGGPTVALEAHAVGTPVIGTSIGGLSELVTDGVNGRLVAPGDWRMLAELVQSIVADPSGTVDAWRRSLPTARTLDDVTREYLAMYAA
jgi:glycosyltransferase involved in cell wall biosynthesis